MTANAAFQIRAVFQSLFFWMMPTGWIGRDGRAYVTEMFQSLFFWMMPTG